MSRVTLAETVERGVCCGGDARLTRRRLLGGAGASLALWGCIPMTAAAMGRDPRLLTVILRGGLDGLAMVAPVGDPDYARLRGHLAVPASGAGGIALDPFFVLNGNMPFLGELYAKRQALFVHAVATPYRARSHFDGQDVLESGLPGVARTEAGWLNRALAGLPSAGGAKLQKGLAMGAVVPLVMRGPAPVLSWIPKTSGLPLHSSTAARLIDLYNVTDPRLAKAFAEGLEIDRLSDDVLAAETSAKPKVRPATSPGPQVAPRLFREFVEAAETAARFLAADDGPRIGALGYNGWDTHANEGVVQGQLGNRLAGLDAAIRALHDGLGPAWKDTVISIVTEFGRTARANGTEGTDHGTATVALLVGGAVRGGRVVAEWPGLAEKALFEARDLAPTRDLRAVLKGVLRDHLGIPEKSLGTTVFPESLAVKPEADLIA